MKNIKNNKISSWPVLALKNWPGLDKLTPSRISDVKAVPFFKNPNSLLLEQPIKFTAASSVSEEKKSTSPGEIKICSPAPTNKFLTRLQLSKNNWPGLVFLQKKGSSHTNPNPNFISYNFPGTVTAISGNTISPTTSACTDSATSSSRLSSTSTRNTDSSTQAHTKAYKAVNIFNKFTINNVYRLLFYFFKSMYCLISKPVFIATPDKLKIQLFYFVCIPKFLNADTLALQPQFLVQNQNLVHPQTSKKVKGKNLPRSRSFLNWKSKGLKHKFILKNLAIRNITKVYPNKFNLICSILSKFFKKPVELELIRLHQPYYDSNILVNFLALIINKKNIGACIHRLFNKNIIQIPKAAAFGPYNFSRVANATTRPTNNVDNIYNPSTRLVVTAGQAGAAYLSGLNIKISGRLMREPIIPRITTKKFEKGFTAKGKINYSDLARFTHKNRKGAFTITVKSGQNF